MSGSRLNAIANLLDAIHGKVRAISLEYLVQGKNPGANEAAPMIASARADALRSKLSPILDDLAILRRELLGVEKMLDHRERLAHRLPRELRYRERQSIASTRSQQGELFQTLTDIVDEVLDIWGNQSPSDAELRDAAADAVKTAIEFKQELTSKIQDMRALIERAPGPVIQAPAATTLQNVSFDSLVIAAWLLVYALQRRKS